MIKNDGKFKPGMSGNPGGRMKLPEELRKLPPITKELINRLINKIGSLSVVKLEEFLQDKEAPAFEAMIASAIYRAITEGDVSRMDFLLNRTIGKVADVIEAKVAHYDKRLDEVPKEQILTMLKAANQG